MREIKFRQYFDGSFHYWGYIKGKFITPLTNSEAHRIKSQQFTGLLDKQGIEIYEGDIVSPDGNKKHLFLGVVKSKRRLDSNQGFINLYVEGVRDKFEQDYLPDYYEVIGNIYENKDLLK